MGRPVTLFTGQWADLPIETMCEKALEFGYDGLELCTWGDHIEIDKADQAYCDARKELLAKYDLQLFAISTHLIGQCVCDPIDERHKGILPGYIWGDGNPEGVRQPCCGRNYQNRKSSQNVGIGHRDRFYRKFDLAFALFVSGCQSGNDRQRI